jgi:methylated-DNA-[protein]-cysteine S-methyltransferase
MFVPAPVGKSERLYNSSIGSRPKTVKAACGADILVCRDENEPWETPAVSTESHIFPSDLGWMALAWTGNRLNRFTFGHPSAAAASASLETDEPAAERSPSPPPWVSDLAARLQSYAAGNAESFDDVPLDLSHLSSFQSSVVKACRKISRGKVRTYGELAAAAGSPGAARAVGSVMAKNRFPIIVPCHRVVGAAGSLGGFSARDGVNMKRRMLELEGAADGRVGQGRRGRRSTMSTR